ncbi:phospholipase D alpha 2-like [Triticum urartu]|nr:phospholipase D alpha 2-like [Triticum urartu]
MAHLRLHGTINATILGADNIHDRSRHTGIVPSFLGNIVQGVQETTSLGKGLSRMYAAIYLGSACIARTRTIAVPAAGSARWNEPLRAYCAHHAADVVISVMIEQLGLNDDTVLGRAYLPARELLNANGTTIDRWFDVLGTDRNKLPDGPKIHVQISFRDVADQGLAWGGGVGDGVVPHTFFSQRPGCRVTLYQDAHASAEFDPKIRLDGGGLYKPGRCWEDIYDAISNARHLVYITAWSMFPHITLVRERDGRQETLGELLKRKAGEGVQVLLLVWNDISSIDGLHEVGVMDTRDQLTAKYFRGSRVQCVLCPRNWSVRGYILDAKTPVDTVVYSHHQKAITVDQELPASSGSDGRRQIVSFLGGLDVCNGRYDTQSHSLFRTLGTGQAHNNDFSQINFSDEAATLDKGGPRTPWHDIHAKVEGAAAWDVLHNFEQRWSKQGGGKEHLVDLVALEGKVAPSSWPVTLPGDQEAWNVQLFRSIDSISTVGFPDSMEDAYEAGLIQDKHRVFERSIQDAYIHAIRAANSFIYIENQYFAGSSFQWKTHDGIDPADVGACQQIPRELSLKIVSKIEAGERFAVYVVVPMWSEGTPTGRYRQAMLDNQRRTMALMYDDIAVALQAKKIDADPRDYLTFFCLGNREAKSEGEHLPAKHPKDGTDYARAQKARRFMIYVHSKMMIVDDEYIVVGSANLNERSMAGDRDSEIAIGAFQPHRVNTDAELAKGHVHGFRMSLWHEHLGKTHDDFLRPGSLECVRRVNKMADEYWNLYVGDQQLTDDLPGHLLTYPVAVSKAGTVSTLKGFEFFPDTKAPVLGKPTGINDYFMSI